MECGQVWRLFSKLAPPIWNTQKHLTERKKFDRVKTECDNVLCANKHIYIFFLYFSKQFVFVYPCFAEQAKLSKRVQSRFLFYNY